jgi:hypothetical protein
MMGVIPLPAAIVTKFLAFLGSVKLPVGEDTKIG